MRFAYSQDLEGWVGVSIAWLSVLNNASPVFSVGDLEICALSGEFHMARSRSVFVAVPQHTPYRGILYFYLPWGKGGMRHAQ